MSKYIHKSANNHNSVSEHKEVFKISGCRNISALLKIYSAAWLDTAMIWISAAVGAAILLSSVLLLQPAKANIEDHRFYLQIVLR